MACEALPQGGGDFRKPEDIIQSTTDKNYVRLS